MPDLSLDLRKDIQDFLLNIIGIGNVTVRQALGRNAGLPDELYNQVDWKMQPTIDFVSHFVDIASKYGQFPEDQRYTLVEYLKATRDRGGGEHRRQLDDLLARLAREWAFSADNAGGGAKTSPQTPRSVDPIKLFDLIMDTFSEREIRYEVCFRLSPRVDYEGLPGDGKAEKFMELVNYLERRESLDEFVALGRSRRPKADWDSVFA